MGRLELCRVNFATDDDDASCPVAAAAFGATFVLKTARNNLVRNVDESFTNVWCLLTTN